MENPNSTWDPQALIMHTGLSVLGVYNPGTLGIKGHKSQAQRLVRRMKTHAKWVSGVARCTGT